MSTNRTLFLSLSGPPCHPPFFLCLDFLFAYSSSASSNSIFATITSVPLGEANMDNLAEDKPTYLTSLPPPRLRECQALIVQTQFLFQFSQDVCWDIAARSKT